MKQATLGDSAPNAIAREDQAQRIQELNQNNVTKTETGNSLLRLDHHMLRETPQQHASKLMAQPRLRMCQ